MASNPVSRSLTLRFSGRKNSPFDLIISFDGNNVFFNSVPIPLLDPEEYDPDSEELEVYEKIIEEHDNSLMAQIVSTLFCGIDYPEEISGILPFEEVIDQLIKRLINPNHKIHSEYHVDFDTLILKISDTGHTLQLPTTGTQTFNFDFAGEIAKLH